VPVLNELEKKLNAIPVRPGDKDATNKIVFIITDGESGSETTMKINQMKKK
jgi:hypothetical protein